MKQLFIIFLGSVEGKGESMPRWRAYVMVEGEFVQRFLSLGSVKGFQLEFCGSVKPFPGAGF